MSVGFRKSLFGFNCQDVMDYIEKTHKSFVKKESELNGRVDELLGQLDASKTEHRQLLAEKERLDKRLAEFNEKYDEIERLSENIGKLYLVAQANARAIMESSESNAEITREEVDRNLSTIDEAHVSLKELRADITKTSEDFVGEVDRLISSLTDTREKIALNASASENAKKQFDEVYNSIVK